VPCHEAQTRGEAPHPEFARRARKFRPLPARGRGKAARLSLNLEATLRRRPSGRSRRGSRPRLGRPRAYDPDAALARAVDAFWDAGLRRRRLTTSPWRPG